MEKYITESTFGDGSKLLHIEGIDDIARNLHQPFPTKRYFKIPSVDLLEEVSVALIIAPKLSN